jgi:hypothetical protein
VPAGLVQDPVCRLPYRDEEVIRTCLHRVSADERWLLYGLVGMLDRAAADADVARARQRILQVIELTTDATPLRACLSSLAGSRLDRLFESQRQAHGFVPGYGAGLPWRKHLTANVGSTGQWHARPCHYENFGSVNLPDNGWQHQPVSLHWRHRTGVPLGLSRDVYHATDGTLTARFDLAPTPEAKLVADLIASDPKAIGFSIGTRGGYHDWTVILDPDEWAPSQDAFDLVTFEDGDLVEVSATPDPALSGTGVISIDGARR